MASLDSYFRSDLDLSSLSAHLRGLSEQPRLEAVLSLSAGQQARLFEAAKGFMPIGCEDIVPARFGSLRPVIHSGRNSLALFTRFEKRFCRAPSRSSTPVAELWGYNRQTWSLFTGPGYFVAYEINAGEVLIEYTVVPPRGAHGWPLVRSNRERLGRFIYHGTQDTLRGIAPGVTIGRAARKGQWMDNWFVLCAVGL